MNRKRIISSLLLITAGLFGFQPTNIHAQEVELVWTVNNEPDLVASRIYRKTHPDSTFILIGSVVYPDSVFSDQEIGLNLTYYYAVTAVDSYDNESDFSNIAVVSTQANPPVAVADQATTNEDSPVDIDVLANDSDPEGDPLSVTSVTQPGHGATAINGNFTIKYTPTPNFNGTDTFFYTVSDGLGGTASAQVTVTVIGQNHDPVAIADRDTTNRKTPLNIDVLANDSDSDNDALTVSAVTQPGNGSASIDSDGTVKYIPHNSFSGTDTFGYTISDGSGGTGTAQVTVVVLDVRPNSPKRLRAKFNRSILP